MRKSLGDWLRALPLLVTLPHWAHAQTTSLVNCTQAPNCTFGHRLPCNVKDIYHDTCGQCLPGASGIPGVSNSACLAPRSCAAIYPGQHLCTPPDRTTRAPFIVPFDRCVCDDGSGLMWPTAPGRCAKLEVSTAGLYTLHKCRTRNCDPASCNILTQWFPQRIGQRPTFECRRRGSDSMKLSDGCSFEDVGRFTEPSLCGHPGVTSHTVVEASDHAVNCELAPMCPGSVLGGTRLEESCCEGTVLSRPVQEGNRGEAPAEGFCRVGLAEGEACTVSTIGPGWKGCSCLNSDGHPRVDRQCTTECIPPECPLPSEGIPRTPERWITSAVPSYFFQANKIGVAGAQPRPVHWHLVMVPIAVALTVLERL